MSRASDSVKGKLSNVCNTFHMNHRTVTGSQKGTKTELKRSQYFIIFHLQVCHIVHTY